EWWQSAEARRLALSAGRYLLLALAALLLYLLILRPLIRRVTQLPPASQAPAAGVDERAGDAVEDDADDDADTTYTRPPRRRKSTAYEQNLSDLREMAQGDPRMVAMIVRSWMNKHE
ncbi:MAG TPA: flagellar basal body M-ring protein FliF, partial [Halomonas sp.]|nr:flagellar basal body M-ring protein FliF [Halomonas sp.]